ncbi:MAG: glycine cleavage system protein H [Halobacteriovoraceae bacterium]|nr:glycine cleavage system protein H [Halobacteriovoraceae bacterium]|tara:strand:+ start:1104 stop:1490 length:387 start_codon:yes stop_codon:yes gene_type:complete
MDYNVPQNLSYTKDHEWASINDSEATVGITDFAQSSLGDIVFVELPEVGSNISQGEAFGVVESIKSVSDLYSPLSGEVVAINDNLEGQPELLNESPYDNWIIKIKISKTEETQGMLSSDEYEKLQVEQ